MLFSGDEHVAAKTDATGLARFPWPHPVPIFVRVPGVGYGATGLFPLRAGKTVRVPLPRLAPFGMIEGTVPAELRKPGLIASNDPYGVKNWLRCEAAVDNDGHFVLKDVPAGGALLVARVKGKTHPPACADVFVDPGERFAHLAMIATSPLFEPELAPQQPDEEKPVRAETEEKEPKPVLWAEGTVRDEAGQPLEGAQVFASVVEHGGNDLLEFASAITDSRGRWQIMGPPWPMPWPFVSRGHLLVCKFGYRYAVVPMRCPHPPDAEVEGFARAGDKLRPSPAMKPQHFEIALSAPCGGMEVLVTRDGKPLPDAMVSVAEDAPEELLLGAASEAGAWDDAAERILHPISMTGKDGIARFNELTPGNYAILVDDHLPDPRFISQLWERGVGGRFTGSWPPYHGIVVESGKVRRVHALVAAADYSVPLRVMNPDGKPAAGLAITRGFAGQVGETTDANGFVLTHYDLAGLKEFSYTFELGATDAAFNMDREYFKPYCEIESTVTASDRLRSGPPVAITATRRENLPGSLLVQLQDREGKPAVGYVFASDNQGLEREASSDEKGEVRFEGMMPQTESIGANLPGMKLPQFDWWATPLPKDNELIGHWTVFPKNIDCRLGAEEAVVLRPAPAGFVRGVLRPAAGSDIERYSIEDRSIPKNGEFLLGPYPQGKTVVTLYRWCSSSRRIECEHEVVEVRSDRVAHIEFDETKPVIGPAAQTKSCDAGAQVIDAEVSVFLPDGHTPASGAQVALLTQSNFGPLEQGMPDASGRCTILATLPDYPWSTPNLEANLDRMPNEPTFVAWIPGRFGPAVAPAKSADDKGKLRLVLPPSAAQRGKITIGGKELTEERGQLRVMAGREGTARLNALFSQYVSADPEGNFELPALAPGVYLVQAALDDIWLSESARIVVSADAASLKPIILNIGEPGPASTVAVVDGHGKPSPDVKVTVVRPSGPLASLLWSHAFTTDGAGVAQIPPLEAGQHIIRITGIPGESHLVVPPLSDLKAPPAALRATIVGPPNR
jgi:protocatechuate 3,4-dioxygenase beta subunit